MFHPLRHSIEIFSYVFVVNVALGVVMYYVGEDKLVAFLGQNKYLAPLLSDCRRRNTKLCFFSRSSELYIMGGLGFGATLGGLCMNAGLGFVYLFKDVKHTKRNVAIFFAMFLISVAVAYAFSAIFSFDVLRF